MNQAKDQLRNLDLLLYISTFNFSLSNLVLNLLDKTSSAFDRFLLFLAGIGKSLLYNPILHKARVNQQLKPSLPPNACIVVHVVASEERVSEYNFYTPHIKHLLDPEQAQSVCVIDPMEFKEGLGGEGHVYFVYLDYDVLEV